MWLIRKCKLTPTAAILGIALAGVVAHAQPVHYEAEPNDTPAEANEIAGAVTVMGAFEGGRDQDAFQWTVSDVDAQKRWTIELEGLPGTVTSVQIFRLKFAENGAHVVSKDNLLKVSSNGIKPGRAEDLIFEPGEYTLGVARAGSRAGGYRVHLRVGRKLVLDRRAKTYESQDSAYQLRPRTEYAVFLDSPESWFRFEIDEEAAGLRWQIRGQLPVGESLQGVVRDASGVTLARMRADEAGMLASNELALEPGSYFVAIPGKEGGAIRSISLASTGPHSASATSPATADDRPRATTGRWELAERVEFDQPIVGRFDDSKEQHFYSFRLDEATTAETLAFRLAPAAERKVQLCLLDAHGKKVQCRGAEQSVELPDLVLTGGEWGLLAETNSGDPTEYTLALASQGPIDPDGEAEPNDNAKQATGIRPDQQITGRFTGRDEEFFRLLVTGEPELWRFEVEGDGVTYLRLHDGAGAQSQSVSPDRGKRTVGLSNVFLMPGRHYVSIVGVDGSFSIKAKPLGPPHPDSELEPNDDKSRAEVLALEQNRFGTLENTGENDFYRFSLANLEHLRLSIEPPDAGQIHAWMSYEGFQFASQRVEAPGAAVLQGMFPPGDYEIRLGGARQPNRERYHIRLERLPRFGCSIECEPVPTRKVYFGDAENPTSTVDLLPVKAELVPEVDTVAAYLRFGQRVSAQLHLENPGASAVSLELETATSDYRWPALAPAIPVEIGPGATEVVSIDIGVPPDAWAGHPVVVSVRVYDDTGAQTETAAVIEVDGRVEPVHPELAWPVPATMLGGINAAWSQLGGRLLGVEEGSNPVAIPGVGRYMDLLIDGKVRPSAGPVLDPGGPTEEISITVELAGDEPQEVVGVILNPVGRDKPTRWIDEFEVLLSVDGVRFDSALRGRLRQLPQEQAFALERPTPARFARLVILSAHNGSLRRGAGIGEWKVVVRPGTDLSAGRGWNLADPYAGGHVVWARPVISNPWERSILTEKQEHVSHYLRPGHSIEWAISFQHQRAARISRFEWVDSERTTPENRIDKISIAVSLSSPVGPWTKVKDWDRSRSPNALVLDEPVWARYVRFTYPGPEKKSRRFVPETLRIFEQPSDSEYSSILGEWGEVSWPAQYEVTHGLDIATESDIASGNNSRGTASPLTLDQQVGGRVMLGEEEDWYKLTTPAGVNTLKIELGGTPTVRTVVQLLDASGSAVPMRKAGGQSDRKRFRAFVESGKTYYLEVEEPPRAVVFAFDNSGSVTAFKNAIYRAVNAYAGDLVPGRDVANILPFGDAFLMTDWMGEPYILRMVLNDYDRKAASSEAEKSLDKATRQLKRRPGSKAVVLVTDAATPRFAKVWDSLERVQPRVFTMRVGHGDTTGLYEDLMQSWARVNDGHYDFLSTQGEMDRAFDRAATMLRRPADYTLQVGASFEKAPGPGKLQVTSGDTNLGGAVALILDASGSMLKRMGGARRIEIAKDLLSKAVTEHIPPETPVALRVFGHKEPNACRTDLVVPMKPLDPTAMSETLAGISAKNLAKTPIADSLAKVESDLKGAKGTRVVVLVTDGEETCDGDPQAVLAKLGERGIDLRLEIVGFAIADDDLKAQFEGWAEQGGGRYFDAGDAESLERSLAEALKVPYTVYDQDGLKVAEGTVDSAPVELEAGTYRVSIATSPPRTIDEVEIPGESLIEVAVPKADS